LNQSFITLQKKICDHLLSLHVVVINCFCMSNYKTIILFWYSLLLLAINFASYKNCYLIFVNNYMFNSNTYVKVAKTSLWLSMIAYYIVVIEVWNNTSSMKLLYCQVIGFHTNVCARWLSGIMKTGNGWSTLRQTSGGLNVCWH